jgi:hypothetical protein
MSSAGLGFSGVRGFTIEEMEGCFFYISAEEVECFFYI